MDLLQIKNEQAKAVFMSADFQERWQAYKKAFGKELDDWFGDAYTLKVRVAESLSYLYENRLYEAYAELRHFASVCTTDQDKRMLDKLITLCKNQKEMQKAKVGDWVRQSHGGYYQIVRRTPLGAVIKKAFDHKLVFVGESVYANDFSIVLTNLDTYQFLGAQELEVIERFFALYPEQRELFLKQTDAVLALREEILRAGFSEAAWDFRQFCFYRLVRDDVAFVVNLKDLGDRIGVIYGFTSVAEKENLERYGEDDENIKLRFVSFMHSEQDKARAARKVKDVYDAYATASKDEILALKKERQKQFLQKIALALKPLGFRKKGTKWTRALTDGVYLQFEAQKSQWSDVYYFNVGIYRDGIAYPPCYDTRMKTGGKDTYNWQLMRDAELDAFLQDTIQNTLLPMIQTPLDALGGREYIWQGCHCDRRKCEHCWVQKNVWDTLNK